MGWLIQYSIDYLSVKNIPTNVNTWNIYCTTSDVPLTLDIYSNIAKPLWLSRNSSNLNLSHHAKPIKIISIQMQKHQSIYLPLPQLLHEYHVSKCSMDGYWNFNIIVLSFVSHRLKCIMDFIIISWHSPTVRRCQRYNINMMYIFYLINSLFRIPQIYKI